MSDESPFPSGEKKNYIYIKPINKTTFATFCQGCNWPRKHSLTQPLPQQPRQTPNQPSWRLHQNCRFCIPRHSFSGYIYTEAQCVAAHMPCNGSWQACGSKIQMLKILKVQTGDLFPRHFLCVQCASVHYVYVCVCVILTCL